MAALVLGQGTASADTLTFIDDNQVWVAAPDGSAARQVTTNGTAEYPWKSPSTDDSGRILAALQKQLVLMDPAGHALPNSTNLAPMGPCNVSVVGPARARVSASGKLAAFSYFCNSSYWNGSGYSFSNTVNAALALTQSYTASGNQSDWSNYMWPTWYGDRLVTSDGQKLFIQPTDSSPPPPNSPDFGYAFAVADDYYLEEAWMAPNGKRILIDARRKADNADVLLWGTLPGGPPAHANGVTNYLDTICEVPTASDPDSPTISRDGSRIAWSDSQGVKVSGTPTESPGQCDFPDAKVVSPTGSTPAFGGGPTPTAGSGGPGSPAQKTTGVSARGLKASARVKRNGRTTLIRKVTSPGKISVTASTVPKRAKKGIRLVVKKGSNRVIVVAHGPKSWKSLTVRVTASSAGASDGVWTRTWRVKP